MTPLPASPDHAPVLFSRFSGAARFTAPNRIFKSAMSEVLAVQGTHLPTQGHFDLYARWARGGTGVIVTGNVMVDSAALGEPGNVILEGDTPLAPFTKWADAVHSANPDAQVWMQLNHPGKQSPKFLSARPVAPSAVPLGAGLEAAFATPRALSHDEILALIARFATSAARAQQAGFDGVQIHGAHGYLVNQFLSGHHNRRDDQWGGSAENRRRFVLGIYHAIRTAVGPDFAVSIKMNSADFQKDGFGGDDAFDLIAALSEVGIDLIEISGGNYESPAMTGARQSTAREAYFLDFAAQARARTDVALAVTGGFHSVAGMEAALTSGATDFIGIARALTLDPDLPRHAAADPDYTCDVGRPSTGIKAVDRTFMVPITYYETQIRRLARGKAARPGMSAWWSILHSALALGKASVGKRRA